MLAGSVNHGSRNKSSRVDSGYFSRRFRHFFDARSDCCITESTGCGHGSRLEVPFVAGQYIGLGEYTEKRPCMPWDKAEAGLPLVIDPATALTATLSSKAPPDSVPSASWNFGGRDSEGGVGRTKHVRFEGVGEGADGESSRSESGSKGPSSLQMVGNPTEAYPSN